MRTGITFFFLLFMSFLPVNAQGVEGAQGVYRDFPLMITIKFQNFAMPFQDLKGNFRNIGIGLGTEVSWNEGSNWVQQFNLMWFFNRGSGNGWSLYSQMVWRPSLIGDLHGGLKGGVGYTRIYKPNPSFSFRNADWEPGKRSKGMLSIPIGLHLAWLELSPDTYHSPYLSYDLFLHKGFNADVPVIPNTVLEMGDAIYFKD